MWFCGLRPPKPGEDLAIISFLKKKNPPTLKLRTAPDVVGFVRQSRRAKAERGGFEPPVHRLANNGFRDRRIRPLCDEGGL